MSSAKWQTFCLNLIVNLISGAICVKVRHGVGIARDAIENVTKILKNTRKGIWQCPLQTIFAHYIFVSKLEEIFHRYT